MQYNSLQLGETGTGGEYTPQTGFGWTNGVILEFLDRWGRQANHYNTGMYSRYWCFFGINFQGKYLIAPVYTLVRSKR